MSEEPPRPPGEGPKRAPLAPVLGAAERFRPTRSAPAGMGEDGSEDAERQAAVGDFLGDLAHALAARGGAEVEALLERTEHERRRALRDRSELRTLEVGTRLLVRCRSAWPDDPEAAVEAARLAHRLLSDPASEPDLSPAERAAFLASSRDHLAAAERIARRAAEIARRRGRPDRAAEAGSPSDSEDQTAYPLPPLPVSEVAEDALSVEIEAALDDLRDLSLARGRGNDAALAVLDRARLALARGGPEALADLARSEAERFAGPGLPPVPREALRHLAAAAERRAADADLLDRLRRILLAAGVGFSG